ncbi:MAG TPA: hypothetical protein VHC86_07580 [Opitutaceae bacterium]|nr:hypothetical protein [Opitutaceae bacterium]
MTPNSSIRRRGGFSLIEGLGGLLLFALMMGALTYAAAGLFKFQAHPQVSFQGQTYSLAPSFGDFRQAVDLHTRFTQSVDQADSVLVLGGQRSHPTLDPNGPSTTLSESFGDTLLAAAEDSDPFQGYSSWDQRELNTVQFAPYLSASSDPADFTILTVQGLSRVTSVTQQRRYTATVNQQASVFYEVTYQAYDWSSGVAVPVDNAVTGTTPTAFYRIYYAADEDTWAQRPGATHFWYRTDSTWNRDQEGPSRVVFADPYVLAGQDPAAPVSSVSRFVYFLSQLR